MKINVLGTQYTMETHKISQDEILRKNRWSGYCEETLKKIVIADVSEGLSSCAMVPEEGWAKCGEMVDWFAIQMPKIMVAFEKVGCL